MLYVLMLAIAVSIIASKSHLSSSSIIKSSLGLITGCSGTNTVQQSSYGLTDISYVLILLATAIISSLSYVATGRIIGRDVTSLTTLMLSKVCDATCPILSPLIIH